jgi:ABC-type xylose transport system permease subunit
MAEKQESLLFLAIGVIGIIVAIVFIFFLKAPFYKGIAIPLIILGALLGIVGFTVYKRSDADRIRNVYAYDLRPGDLKEKELPRMEKVMKNFVLYRYIEIALVIAGVVLFWYFRTNETRYFWKGIGMGLAVMALLALFADYFAEKRGKTYIDGLQSHLKQNR